jgi:uncharacterized protein (TIGR04255 family)
MTEPTTSLAEFRSPPIVETAIGVEFSPVTGWALPHFGLFWQTIRDEFPRSEVQPPLPSRVERFDRRANQAPFQFQLGLPGQERCWFFHRDDSRLLQLQTDRLILNWRKNKSGNEYPLWEKLLPEFKQHWADFLGFLRREKLPEPQIVQGELTYVDQILKGEGWRDFDDLPKVTPQWKGVASSRLGTPERVAFNACFRLPDNRGRLYLDLQPAIREDGFDVLQLTITVRGDPGADLLDWFALSHRWAVNAFLDFTTQAMHEVWERKTS